MPAILVWWHCSLDPVVADHSLLPAGSLADALALTQNLVLVFLFKHYKCRSSLLIGCSNKRSACSEDCSLFYYSAAFLSLQVFLVTPTLCFLLPGLGEEHMY